jgi:Arc/MetJ-type ribon-helix-helix transcriptional regulator
MTIAMTLRLPEKDAAALDKLVAEGRYPDRSTALRTAVSGLLRAEQERVLAQAYERGYGADPGDEGWAEDAAAAFDAVVAERGE